jgi:sensor histidine kinase regulating citrate/malate metabolism
MRRRHVELDKTAVYAIVINALQIAAALTVAILAIAVGDKAFSGALEQAALSGMALIVVWGATLDIRDAFAARRLNRQSDMLEDALSHVNELNGTLRAQRHDFMNHLQVVFGLIDMGENADARAYIERVYGDIQRVGKALKTSIPAVNALLAAKLAECQTRRIEAVLETHSAWKDVPAADWELCRVLGNIIDNALDALKDKAGAHLTVLIGETLREFTFSVENDGPPIPREMIDDIFEQGSTTHGEGRGMGLFIVREIMETYGGRIEVSSDERATRFSGFLPKAAQGAATENA